MRWWMWVAGALTLLGVLVALLPMRWVTERYAPDLEADRVEGSIWEARFTNARYQGVPLGDIATSLSFRDLLSGQATLAFTKLSEPISGQFFATRSERGVRKLNGQTLLPVLPAPLPPVTLNIADGSVTLSASGACRQAAGRVSTSIEKLPMLGTLPLLEGEPACDGDDLLLPMAARGGAARLGLRVRPGGRWVAELGLRSDSPLAIAGLAALGFRPAGGAMVLDVAGG